MADFDPDAFVAKAQAAPAFDPDAFVKKADQSRLVTPEEAYQDKGVGHSLTFGALDWLPGGKQAAALATALRLKLAGNQMGFGENYHQALGQFDREDAAAKAHQALAHAAGAVPAFALGAAALPGGAATQGALYGGLGSGADDAAAQGDYGGAALRAVLGLGGGALAGKGMQLATKAAAPLLGRAAEGAGNKVRDLAGWLKVNSIHPTPLLAEAMEDVPGGAPAVGRVLLDKGIGGLTKSGTAKQIEAAFGDATGKANELAANYDASGGAPVDLAQAIAAAKAKAANLASRPAKKQAGQQLEALANDYAKKYGEGAAPTTAADALEVKRDLGAEGYGYAADFRATKKAASGDYSEGVRQFERGVNQTLDGALGPDFKAANTLVRQLGMAKQAAERAAARTTGNHLLGLLPYLAGLTGAGAGHMTGQAGPEALAYGLAALMAGKYGAQAGARTLYSPIGGGLNLLGRGLQALPGAMDSGAIGGATSPLVGRLTDLLEHRLPLAPAMADRDAARRQALAQIQGGSP